MSPRRAIALALVACAACSKVRVAPPPLERVTLAPRHERDTPQSDVANSRASVSRLVFDARDAWTVPLGITSSMTGFERGWFPRTIAVGLTGVPADAELAGRVQFVIRWSRGSVEWKVETTIAAADASARWTELAVGADADRETLSVGATWLGEETPALASIRAAFAPSPAHASAAPSREQPSVLLVSIDTLRADHLGCYGYARATSPAIDELAKRGTLFEHASSPAPWTLPAYGSLFTGLLPAEHRAGIVTERERAWGTSETSATKAAERLRDDVPTLAGLLLAHGWRTAAFSCNPFLGPGSGLERGFERYAGYQYNAKAGVDRAIEWLADHKGERFFLFLHLIDPHYPYAPPDPFAKRFGDGALADAPPPLDELRREASDDVRRALVDLYDGEIAFADAQLARLLAAVRELDIEGSTLVVLHADHGEELWDHGGFEHGHTQHEELLHVPLVLALPGRVPSGKRVAQRVRAHDAFATILELCGVARPASTSSESLLAPIESDRNALSESILWGTREEKSLAIGRDKLISDGAGGESLFDLDADPREQQDRASAAPELATKLRGGLRVHHALCAHAAPSATTLQLDEATRSRLDRLGYAGDDDERK